MEENECIGCGCSELEACIDSDGPCHWLALDEGLGLGVCSSCPSHIERFKSHQKEVAAKFSNDGEH